MSKGKKATPERMCVICRQRFAKEKLQRHVCPPPCAPQALILDESKRRPGRGFYVCDQPACRSKFAKFAGWRKKCKGVVNG